MLWILIALGLAIFAGVIGHRFDAGPYALRDTQAAPSFWTTLIVCGIVAVILNVARYDEYKVTEETYNYLENIGDSNGQQGSWSLFGGSIDNQPVYMYYLRDESGKFRLYHVDADSAYVTYTNEAPKIVYHYEYSSNNWMSFNPKDDSPVEYEFRVPEGSVKQNYTLDAQ